MWTSRRRRRGTAAAAVRAPWCDSARIARRASYRTGRETAGLLRWIPHDSAHLRHTHSLWTLRKRPQFSKADCRLAISSALLSESDRRLRSTMGMGSGISEPATAGRSCSGSTYRLGGSSTWPPALAQSEARRYCHGKFPPGVVPAVPPNQKCYLHKLLANATKM